MGELISIRDICERYLTPNDTLDPEIFNTNEQVHPELRSKLLKIADVVIKKSIIYIPGLRFHDICLRGSSAGYHYHEKSDLDVKIMISNENCDFLTKNPENFKVFIQMMKSIAIPNQKFFANDRFVDVKLEIPRTGEHMGLYSLTRNEWINKPDKNYLTSLDIDDVMEEYTKRFHKIKEHLFNIKQSGELSTLEGIYALQDYRSEIFQAAYTDPKEFVIFKLLQKRGITWEIRTLIDESTKTVLSLGL